MTIRQIDDDLKDRLRRRAAANGRSVEGEVRHILSRELDRDDPRNYPVGMAPRPGESFVDHLIRISRPGFDLELPEREIDDRPPIDFE
jgi:antitoxin FitA